MAHIFIEKRQLNNGMKAVNVRSNPSESPTIYVNNWELKCKNILWLLTAYELILIIIVSIT